MHHHCHSTYAYRVKQLINGVAAAGHEVTLYCTRLGEGDRSRIAARIVEVEPSAPAPPDPIGPQDPDVSTGKGSERLVKERGWISHARAMEARETAILAGLGQPDPYAG